MMGHEAGGFVDLDPPRDYLEEFANLLFLKMVCGFFKLFPDLYPQKYSQRAPKMCIQNICVS